MLPFIFVPASEPELLKTALTVSEEENLRRALTKAKIPLLAVAVTKAREGNSTLIGFLADFIRLNCAFLIKKMFFSYHSIVLTILIE